MTTTTRKMIPALLIVLAIAILAQAQPGQARNGRGRAMQPRQNQRGPEMGRMDREGPGPRQMGGPGPRQMGGAGLGIMPVLMQLDLTEEQHDAIRTILDAHKDAAQVTRKEVQKARQALQEAVIEGADEVAIRAIATTLAQAVGDQAIQQVAVTTEIRNVLTEAQKDELKTLMKQTPEDGQDDQGRPQRPERGMRGNREFGPGRGFGQGPGQGPGRRPMDMEQDPMD